MIVSLVLKDKQSINVGERGIFALKNTVRVGEQEEETKIEKQNITDIPFVRYRFDKYDDSDIEYIKKLQGVFKYSAHLAEIVMGKDTTETVETVKKLTESVDRLCRFVYIPVDDEFLAYVAENGAIPDDLENALYDISDIGVDQICIKDKTSAAGLVQMNDVRKLLADIVLGNSRKYEGIGICESPLTFVAENSACLTAAKAREYMAIYCRDDLPQPTPSANHQCMSCCGCIRYVVVDEPIVPYETKKEAAVKAKKEKKAKTDDATENSDDANKKPKMPKSNKTVNIRNIYF